MTTVVFAEEIRVDLQANNVADYTLHMTETDFWFESGQFAAAGNGPIEFMGVKAHEQGALKVAVGSMTGRSRSGAVWGGLGVSGAF